MECKAHLEELDLGRDGGDRVGGGGARRGGGGRADAGEARVAAAEEAVDGRLEGDGRGWKGVEGDGRGWKGMEGDGRGWKATRLESRWSLLMTRPSIDLPSTFHWPSRSGRGDDR